MSAMGRDKEHTTGDVRGGRRGEEAELAQNRERKEGLVAE